MRLRNLVSFHYYRQGACGIRRLIQLAAQCYTLCIVPRESQFRFASPISDSVAVYLVVPVPECLGPGVF